MIKLRTQLNRILKSIHPNVTIDEKNVSRVHFEDAPDTTPFPYIVYFFLPSHVNEEQEVIPMDIDIWDMPSDGDTTVIETLNDTVWKALRKYKYIDENIQFTIHGLNRYPLTDDDKRIRRRKLTFEIRYYDRKVNS